MNMEGSIYIGRYASPFGGINVAQRGLFVLSLDFNSQAPLFKRTLKERFGPAIRLDDSTPGRFDNLFTLFDRYFSGKRVSFDSVKLASQGTPFELRVWEELRKIPFGKVIGYAELARRVGSPGGARAVGGALAKNPVPLIVPCHRIISTSGALGGYSAGGKGRGTAGKLRGVELKRALLELEGVSF
jgi:methylated-DNA-[protein]-cysteine S-methyltransferase